MQGWRVHFTSSCLLIKFYGLIILCKVVVVAFKTLNEKDKLNTLHSRLGQPSIDNLYPSQAQLEEKENIKISIWMANLFTQ